MIIVEKLVLPSTLEKLNGNVLSGCLIMEMELPASLQEIGHGAETDWSEQLLRNAGRADAVPEQAICHMMEELIPPEAKEAYRVQWHTI